MPPDLHETLTELEEALEIASSAEVRALVHALVAAGAGQSPEVAELLRELVILAEAGVEVDRGRCALVCSQLRARGFARPARPTPTPPLALPPAAEPPLTLPAPAPAPSSSPPSSSGGGWTVAPDSADMLLDFAVEARSLLDEAEGACLALDREVSAAAIATAFRAFHTIKGVAGFLELTVLAELAHRIESVLSEVRDGAPPPGDFVDLILAAIDHVRGCIAVATRHGAGDRPDIDGFMLHVQEVLDGLLAGPSAPAAATAPSGIGPAPARPVASPAAASSSAAKPEEHDERSVVKVDIAKMDHLIDLVGELAIAQAQVAGHPELRMLASRELTRAIGLLGRVAKDLQHASLAMRMVAIKATFDRMARIARDTARSLSKPLAFVVEGAQTELDRTMVEAIYDPLVHLIRNALDHGLEGPIERVRKGKPEAGTLTLRAYHQAGHIVVEVADDGGGLDRQRIRARAVERGLIAPDEELADGEIDQLIFAPGFSTAKAVTSVSGRGVGMDVVKTKVEAVRGRVEIHSTPGTGTTFRLKLPLTLAIIDGLLLRAGGQRYAMPTSWARDVFRPTREQLVTVRGRGQMVQVRGALYPLVHLSARLGLAASPIAPTEGVVVMVDDGSRPVCLVADELIGKQEVVVKGLGASLSHLPFLAGATILGDGSIALILDIPAVVSGAGDRRAERYVA
jgi:two-component system chemotaxis sensor kinase CheA